MSEQPQITPIDEEKQAIVRIAATRDGALFHRYLRRVLEGVFDFETDSALRLHTGRRTLARDLMQLMADGLNEHGNSTADAPILARAGKSAAVASSRGRRDPSRFPRVDSFSDALNPDGTEPKA